MPMLSGSLHSGISMGPDAANTLQALSFGIAHWHGVPSGYSGVALTFVFGWLMGALSQYGGGLLFPVVVHAISDWFIFAKVAQNTF